MPQKRKKNQLLSMSLTGAPNTAGRFCYENIPFFLLHQCKITVAHVELIRI